MNQYPEITKVLTENPLIDEIVYEVRQILKGIVVKDEEEADNNETALSLKEADLYHDIQMGTDIFANYTYTYDIFMRVPSMTRDRAIKYAKGTLPIPDGLKDELQRIAREEWLANYDERNEYYRVLWGRPPLGEEYIYLTDEEYEMIPVESYDITKPVHLCTSSEANLLYTNGVIDHMKERCPEAKYLDHLGERSIHPYIARRTPNFGLLYIPSIDSTEVANKWKERFDINRVYAIKTIYSEAYHYKSEYYNKFIIMLIIIMTFDDMIVYSPEYIISRELFDLRTIEYIFEASGVTFYPEIPLKYQKRLVKNLNRLIKYKSSAKCMVDIISLFGFDNMELFKYYLTKRPVVNDDGTYRKDTYTDPDTEEEVLNLESNYTLQFLKVPILGIADDYLDDPFQYIDYDETAADDIYWNGVYTQDYVKHEILKHEFSVQISKYISVDTIYSIAEMQFQMVYFINMLMYSDVDTDILLVDVPEISSTSQFRLVDLIVMLYALGYLYQGVKDTIVYDPIQAIAIEGFNFNTDLSDLIEYVEAQGYTMGDLGLDKFINPNPVGIRSWEELATVYENNKDVYDKLVKLCNNANDYDEYKLYRKVLDSLYVTKLSFNMFREGSSTNSAPTTYSEYLRNVDISLYNTLLECEKIQKDDERQLEISRIINFIVDDIYAYLDRDTFRYAFNGIPTVSMDYIRQYILLIINFFKSYKVDVINSNIIYKFDYRLNNKVMVIDKLLFNYIFNKQDKIHVSDCMYMLDTFEWRENIDLLERIYLDVTYWKEKHFIDDSRFPIKDYWINLLITVYKSDHLSPIDKIAMLKYIYTWTDRVNISDDFELLETIERKDSINIEEGFYMNRVYSD